MIAILLSDTIEDAGGVMNQTTEGAGGVIGPRWEIAVTILSFITFVTIMGNIMAIIAYTTNMKMITTQNCYIINLALTDILVGLIILPTNLYVYIKRQGWVWRLGDDACKVMWAFDAVLLTESILTIILISHDRYLMVKQGVKYCSLQTKCVALCKIMISWVVACLITIPFIVRLGDWHVKQIINGTDIQVDYCQLHIPGSALDSGIAIYYGTITILIPVILIIYLHKVVYRKLTLVTHLNNVIQYETNTPTRRRQRIMRRTFLHSKPGRKMAVIVGTFCICWLPFYISWITSVFCSCISYDILTSLHWLLWFNCSVNPLLYVLTSRKYRRNMVRLWSCTPANQQQKTWATRISQDFISIDNLEVAVVSST